MHECICSGVPCEMTRCDDTTTRTGHDTSVGYFCISYVRMCSYCPATSLSVQVIDLRKVDCRKLIEDDLTALQPIKHSLLSILFCAV